MFPEREAVLALNVMGDRDSFCRLGKAAASWFHGQARPRTSRTDPVEPNR
jgi:hypothetical protein